MMNRMAIQMEQVTRYKTFDITLSNVDIQSSSDEGDQVVIRGPGEFEIVVEKDLQGNYSMPNFSESISGEFRVAVQDTVVLREMPVEEAMDLILKYIQENPDSRTSDILCDLGIDIEIGLNALDQLKENELIHSEELHVNIES